MRTAISAALRHSDWRPSAPTISFDAMVRPSPSCSSTLVGRDDDLIHARIDQRQPGQFGGAPAQGLDQRRVRHVVAEALQTGLGGGESHLGRAQQRSHVVDDADAVNGLAGLPANLADAEVFQQRDGAGEQRRGARIAFRGRRADGGDAQAQSGERQSGRQACGAGADDADVVESRVFMTTPTYPGPSRTQKDHAISTISWRHHHADLAAGNNEVSVTARRDGSGPTSRRPQVVSWRPPRSTTGGPSLPAAASLLRRPLQFAIGEPPHPGRLFFAANLGLGLGETGVNHDHGGWPSCWCRICHMAPGSHLSGQSFTWA